MIERTNRLRELSSQARDAGMPQKRVARIVGKDERTVRRWAASVSEARAQGRPVVHATDAEIVQMEELFEQDNGISIRELQGACPHVARREVRAHVHRLTEAKRDEQASDARQLTWTRPGTVWATDHSHVPAADPEVGVAIALRDLASHEQLLWTAGRETADVTVQQLQESFEAEGAPLVLKADNGPAFKSHKLKALLDDYGVQLLPSPGYYPEFNGSCEAANRHMKRRTRAIAAGKGHPHAWEPWDMELARLQANHRARPWGVAGPSPEGVWSRRRTITDGERTAFRDSCARMWERIIEQMELDEHQLRRDYWARLARRAAISRALVAHGLLIIQRRRIRPPVQAIRAVRLS